MVYRSVLVSNYFAYSLKKFGESYLEYHSKVKTTVRVSVNVRLRITAAFSTFDSNICRNRSSSIAFSSLVSSVRKVLSTVT